MDGFERNCLEAHNKYRAKHGSPPLVWSESLAADAKKWVDELAATNQYKHDPNRGPQGESVSFFTPPRPKCMGERKKECVACEEMVADWYNEVKDYDFNTGKGRNNGDVVLHFTQV